jgi:hypothetical protein
MNWRQKRQIVYGTILSFLFIGFISILYFLNRPPEIPTCFDNKKNQGEEDVDCGGPCPPCELKTAKQLKIYKASFLVFPDKIDLIGAVENPNENLGIKNLNYYFEIYDTNKTLIATTSIRTTILEPDQKRYLIELNYPRPQNIIGSVNLKIIPPKREDWQKISLDKIKLSIYNQRIYQENQKWKISFTIFNPSYYFYSNLELVILLYNENNDLITALKSIISLKPQESRDIILTLPEIFFEPTSAEFIFQRTSFEK